MKIPERIRQKLMATFHNFKSEDGYPVWDNILNEWLCKQFGLQTDSPRYDINNSFIVWFDWNLQVWRVK